MHLHGLRFVLFSSVIILMSIDSIQAREDDGEPRDFLGNRLGHTLLIDLGLGYNGISGDMKDISGGQFNFKALCGYGFTKSLILEAGFEGGGWGKLNSTITDIKIYHDRTGKLKKPYLSTSTFPVGIRSTIELSNLPLGFSLGGGFLYSISNDEIYGTSKEQEEHLFDDYPKEYRNGPGYYIRGLILVNIPSIDWLRCGIHATYSSVTTKGDDFTKYIYKTPGDQTIVDSRFSITFSGLILATAKKSAFSKVKVQ